MDTTHPLVTLQEGHLKNLLRELLQQEGRPVRFTDKDSWEYPGEKAVSFYGWLDFEADQHVRGGDCSWSIAPQARLVQRIYTEFTDTINDPDEQVGINVSPVRCTCGRYQEVHLRYEASFGTVMRDLLKVDDGIAI